MKLVVIICYFLFARLGKLGLDTAAIRNVQRLAVFVQTFYFVLLGLCALYMRCGNFLDVTQQNSDESKVDFIVTDYVNVSLI